MSREADSRLAQIGPAVLGASSFACADVLSKVVLIDGADVLTMSVVRAVLGVAFLFAWLKLVPPRGAFTARATWVSLGLGVLFAGNVFLLFKAFEVVEVPIAILTYSSIRCSPDWWRRRAGSSASRGAAPPRRSPPFSGWR